MKRCLLSRFWDEKLVPLFPDAQGMGFNSGEVCYISYRKKFMIGLQKVRYYNFCTCSN